jgi:hypothetical protein
MLCAAPLGFAPMSGCAALRGPVEYAPGPRTDYLNASNSVKNITQLLRAALADGLIDGDDWVRAVNPAIQETNAALDLWEAAVLDGRAEDIGTARAVAESLIARLRDHLATARLGGGAE